MDVYVCMHACTHTYTYVRHNERFQVTAADTIRHFVCCRHTQLFLKCVSYKLLDSHLVREITLDTCQYVQNKKEMSFYEAEIEKVRIYITDIPRFPDVRMRTRWKPVQN